MKKRIIQLQELEKEWTEMISKSDDLFKQSLDHLVFYLNPPSAWLHLGFGKNPISEKFPDLVKYANFREYCSDDKFLNNIYSSYFSESTLYFNGEILEPEELGDEGFSKPIVNLAADWTYSYLKKIGSPVKKLYFSDDSFLIEKTYELN